MTGLREEEYLYNWQRRSARVGSWSSSSEPAWHRMPLYQSECMW